MRKLSPLVVMLVLGGLAVGCKGETSGHVTVSGQLLQNGKPVKLNTQVMKTMIFFPYDATKEGKLLSTFPAVVQEDGSFTATMPAGKYVITLTLLENGDLCKGAFEGKDKSKLIREVDGTKPLEIEITKPGG